MRSLKLLFTLFLSQALFAQSFADEYSKAKKAGVDSNLYSVLSAWKQFEPGNLVMHLAHMNYYYGKSFKEITVRNDTVPAEFESYIEKDTSGKDFQVYTVQIIVDSLFDLAIYHADEALKINPRRLDVEFGKIYCYANTGQYEKQKDYFLNIIEKDKVKTQPWLWTNDAERAEEDFFVSKMTEYLNGMFYNEAIPLDYIRDISNAMLSYNPNNTLFISYLGACEMAEKDYTEAIYYYSKAAEIDPMDLVIYSNLGTCYEKMGDRKGAKKIYEYIMANGAEQDQEFAAQKLAELYEKKKKKKRKG